MIKRRATPVLASAAIALSLAGCGWMGMGDKPQQTSQGAAASTKDTRMPLSGQMSSADAQTPTSQQYPQGAAQTQAVSDQMVQSIQRQLGQRGYDVGPIDGLMGQSTQSALRNFQRDQGLPTSGQIDQQTLAALGMGSGQQQRMSQQQRSQQDYKPTTRRGAMMDQEHRRQGMPQQSMASAGMDPDTVRNIQQQLDRRGYDVGEVDGVWGPRTRQAVTAFQRDENLRSSGQLDQQTLAALGMDQGQQVGEMPSEPQQSTTPQERTGATPDTGEADIGPREQTGQLPGITDEPQEPGTLPDTGSEAPGSAQESERSGGIQGNEPSSETPLGGTPDTPR